MFDFKEVLHGCGLDLDSTLVLRHVPVEARLRQSFAWVGCIQT
ncbi:MAG: hypothetical protein JWP89_845 [Schlesneria sp.]|nr:hypothetical protein [Schlesneria sp.]